MLLVFLVLYGLVFLRDAIAAVSNRTIDDTNGDSVTGHRPIYKPVTGTWQGNTCMGCNMQPDANKFFDGTWMAATYNVALGNISITMTFKGTAISVFFFLVNSPNSTYMTECNFRLDGVIAGNYSHVSDESGEFTYGVLVFNSAVLPAARHTLTIEVSGDQDAFIGFDNAVYTFDDSVLVGGITASSAPPAPNVAISVLPSNSTVSTSDSTDSALPTITYPSNLKNSPTKTTPPKLAVVLAGVLGSLLVVQTFVFFLWRSLRHCHRARLREKNMETPMPFTLTVSGNIEGGQVDHKRNGRVTFARNWVVRRFSRKPKDVESLEETAESLQARQVSGEEPPQYHSLVDNTTW